MVLKFGGSSVADNEKLKIVANKIIDLYNKEHNIVVILSAQGKTTDKLIQEAKELRESSVDNSNKLKSEEYNTIYNRELDTLISTGEQISIAKLSILLNGLRI